MPYTVPITDDRQRDAAVEALSPRKAGRTRYQAKDGSTPEVARLIKATEHTSYETLLAGASGDLDALADQLIAGDPEVPLEQIGGRLREGSRVYLKADGSVLYAARILRVVSDPQGQEVSREDFVDVEATVGAETPALPWTGKLLDSAEVVHRFALVRKLQLRHVNGLTYDFLFEMAKTLHEAGKVMLVGSGKKGAQPLIFTRNGSPYRGFLEGRIDGKAFRLVLHLSNMELKAPPPAPAAEGDA